MYLYRVYIIGSTPTILYLKVFFMTFTNEISWPLDTQVTVHIHNSYTHGDIPLHNKCIFSTPHSTKTNNKCCSNDQMKSANQNQTLNYYCFLIILKDKTITVPVGAEQQFNFDAT